MGAVSSDGVALCLCLSVCGSVCMCVRGLCLATVSLCVCVSEAPQETVFLARPSDGVAHHLAECTPCTARDIVVYIYIHIYIYIVIRICMCIYIYIYIYICIGVVAAIGDGVA